MLEEIRTLSSGKKGGLEHFHLEALSHTYPPPSDQKKKMTKFSQFALAISTPSPQKKNLVPPTRTLEPLGRPIKRISRGKVQGPWGPLYQFNFNQLAQVLYMHLTLLILSCVIKYDI